MKNYLDRVKDQCVRNPELIPLRRFLSADRPEIFHCETSLLTIYSEEKFSTCSTIERNSLDKVINSKHSSQTLNDETTKAVQDPFGAILGRVLIVEDLSRDLIEFLGSALDIDPIFFVRHLVGTVSNFRFHTTPPSKTWSRSYINMFYSRVISFESHGRAIAQRSRLKVNRNSNVNRKVVILPSMDGTTIGLVQHCCSVFMTVNEDEKWFGIVLCDPPLESFYTCTEPGLESTILRPAPFYDNPQDRAEPGLFESLRSLRQAPCFRGLKDDLQDHWNHRKMKRLAQASPSLRALSYPILKIVAREWSKYANVLYHCIKYFEYSINETANISAGLHRLNSDLDLLQSWRRRIMSSQEKIDLVIRFLTTQETSCFGDEQEEVEEVLDEFLHLAKSMETYGQRLENMLPVLASVIQLVDSRRSFAETANISRLTILALVFVPLTFVASLFSMSGEIAPGQRRFWLYFAVAVPMTLLVFVIARPPVSGTKILSCLSRVSGGGRESHVSRRRASAVPTNLEA